MNCDEARMKCVAKQMAGKDFCEDKKDTYENLKLKFEIEKILNDCAIEYLAGAS